MTRTKASAAKASTAGASFATALVLRSVLRAPLTTELTTPVIASTVPAWWWLMAAAVAGAVGGGLLAKWLEKRDRIGATYPLMLPGVALVAYVPGAVRWVPFLSALTGPLLDLILLGSLLAAAGRLFAGASVGLRVHGGHVALGVFALLMLVGLRQQARVGLSGDEPHYLLITQSLLRDGDLKVADNYARRDFEAFYRGKIGPHLAYGSDYSVHGTGLPLLLLPGFAVAGLFGVLLTEAVIGALIAWEIFRIAVFLSGSAKVALLASGGFVLTAPALFLCVSAYPELPAAWIAIAVSRRILETEPPGRLAAFSWAAAIGLLPWLHVKFMLLSGVLGLVVLARWTKLWRWLAGGMVLALATLPLFFWWTSGDPNPLAGYGRQRIFLQNVPTGLAGLFFDQEFGLLPVSPWYLLGLAGIGVVTRRAAFAGAASLGVLLAVALPGAAHPLWTGGTSPPARFLFPALPLLVVCATVAWGWAPGRGVFRWAETLWVASVCLGVFMLLAPEQPLYLNQRDGSGRVWEALGASWDLNHYLPSLVRGDPRSIAMAAAGGMLILVAVTSVLRSGWAYWPPALLSVALVLTGMDHLAAGEPATSSRPRWMERLLVALPDRKEHAFVSLPWMDALSRAELLRAIRLPLSPAPRSREAELAGEGEEHGTRAVRIPAGRYVLDGARETVLTLCNGEGCFAEGMPGERKMFTVRVGLESFRVRADREPEGLALEPVEIFPRGRWARSSVGSPAGVRLHSLDENAFVEPGGVWVQAERTATIALEGRCEACRLVMSNGASSNWIRVAGWGPARSVSFRPGETKTMNLPVLDGLLTLTLASRSGFRPAELDPRSSDRRPLGIFLNVVPRAFD